METRIIEPEYYIDEVLIERFAEALVTKNKELMDEVIYDAKLRVDGVCFCFAHSSNECLCGAWDK